MRLIRMPDVIALVGLKKTAIYDRIQRGEFPAPVKIGGAAAWVESEVTAWIQALVDKR